MDEMEFKPIRKLDPVRESYVTIPSRVFEDAERGYKKAGRRAVVLAFFLFRCGKDGIAGFTLQAIMDWAGRTCDKNNQGSNAGYVEAINSLELDGFIDVLDTEKGNDSRGSRKFTPLQYREAVVRKDELTRRLQDKDNEERDYFAVVYLDEVRRVLGYKNDEQIKNAFPDNRIECESLFLVYCHLFKWLRSKARLNTPREACDGDYFKNGKWDWVAMQRDFPEAYDFTYKGIAEELGMTEEAVSKAAQMLDVLGLVRPCALQRVKADDDSWSTLNTIFVSYQKRDAKKMELIQQGSEYWMREARNRLLWLKANYPQRYKNIRFKDSDLW